MDESKVIKTLISTSTKLDLDEIGLFLEEKLFRGMIRSLLCLTTSRPDIVYNIGLCSRFQAKAKEYYLKVVKKNLKVSIGYY